DGAAVPRWCSVTRTPAARASTRRRRCSGRARTGGYPTSSNRDGTMRFVCSAGPRGSTRGTRRTAAMDFASIRPSSITSCGRAFATSATTGAAPWVGRAVASATTRRCWSTSRARRGRRPMRFGTYYFLQAPPSITHPDVIRHEIEQMVWTEELGFDSIWLTEHHFIDYGLSVSPAVLAAAAAMRTRRVRIGLAAAILPFHDPVRLAEELAIVDILSEGRLDVGVGRGNRPVAFEGYRVPQIENRERFEECL